MKKTYLILYVALYSVFALDIPVGQPSAPQPPHPLPQNEEDEVPQIYLTNPKGKRKKLDIDEEWDIVESPTQKRKPSPDPFLLQIPKPSYMDPATKKKLDKWDSLSHEQRSARITRDPSIITSLISSNKAQITEFGDYHFIKGYLPSREAYVNYYGQVADKKTMGMHFDEVNGDNFFTAETILGNGLYGKAKQGIPLTKEDVQMIYDMHTITQSLVHDPLTNNEKEISLVVGGDELDFVSLYKKGDTLVYKYPPLFTSFNDVVGFIKKGILFNDRNAFKDWLMRRTSREKFGLVNLLKTIQDRRSFDNEFIKEYESVLNEVK